MTNFLQTNSGFSPTKDTSSLPWNGPNPTRQPTQRTVRGIDEAGQNWVSLQNSLCKQRGLRI